MGFHASINTPGRWIEVQKRWDMAIVKTHTLDYGEQSWPKPLITLEYGKCELPAYRDNNLWFVTIPQGYTWDESMREDMRYPEEPHTFLVDAKFTSVPELEKRKRDIEAWKQIARLTFVGSWCTRYEMLWKDIPVYIHKLPNGSVMKYGYCRAQSLGQPNRELWFVAFRDDLLQRIPGTFVIDKLCIDHEFLARMGNDHYKWEIICWSRLDEGNEVRWNELETGTLAGGYVRGHSRFAFDSPYLPLSLDDIPNRLKIYEEAIATSKASYERQYQGVFNRGKRWENLDDSERGRLLQSWSQRAAQKVLKLHRES